MNKVAVLMSTYNGEKYLEQQVESILNQKCKYPIDIYIRDDGSTDGTIEIINKYVKYKNVKLIKGKNVGLNESFFTLLKNVKDYKYYSLSDQDDFWIEDKIQAGIEMIEALNYEGPVLYGSCSYLVHDDMKPFGTTQQKMKEVTFYNSIIQNFLPGHSQIMNEKLHLLLQRDIDYKKIYVYDSWIMNVAMVEGRVLFDNMPHTLYRMHNNNELGFGDSKIGWVKERIHRIQNNQSLEYANQIDYFFEIYGRDLKPEYAQEILKYQKSNDCFLSRIIYGITTKLYRQKNIENFAFKLLYICGKYNTSKKV